MVTEDFGKFVESQQPSGADATTDWAQIRDEWLRNLDALYTMVIGFLQEYIDRGLISYKFTPLELNEQDLGSYTARRMDIKIGRQHASLVPVGTLFMGCKGRVDVEGSAGRARILLMSQRIKGAADLVKPTQEPSSWEWKIVTNSSPVTFVDLDRETFFTLVMEIANA